MLKSLSAGIQVTGQAEEDESFSFVSTAWFIFVQEDDDSISSIVRRRPASTFWNGRGRYPNLFVLEDALLRDAVFIGATRNDRPVGRGLEIFHFALSFQRALRLEMLDYAN
jgi:hypothetical protein